MKTDAEGLSCGTVERCEACREVADNGILWKSLPVPSFGDHRSKDVKVATIAVNPAGGEFFVNGHAKDPKERLSLLWDYHKLHRSDLMLIDIKNAQERRKWYFCNTQGIRRNYYHPWFDPLESILRGINPGWSYFNGTAVHIDLVACTTKPSWRNLPNQTKKLLQQNCQPHFRRTLSELPAGTVLLSNGLGLREIPVEINSEPELLNASPRLTIWRGAAKLNERSFPFLGWNVTAKYLTDDQKASLFAAVGQNSLRPFSD